MFALGIIGAFTVLVSCSESEKESCKQEITVNKYASGRKVDDSVTVKSISDGCPEACGSSCSFTYNELGQVLRSTCTYWEACTCTSRSCTNLTDGYGRVTYEFCTCKSTQASMAVP
jgi:hypothetical protein